ncbi:EcsC family protein [Acinetobacter shaoyimingii]|uniref:EcsC family protein n=2 Tax=Acinetobacter shaoyimingii TaxID=2715164 RepID=A0A6G8RZZ7_9GAMM|nr:EcsC family protein [Acinetobacter shaoyimingii]QIO07420.1 EcsC family protein [Acinetobacter shaoyimingii]
MYMANSYNKQSRGLISNAFGVAKKLTNTGFDLLTHVAPGSVSKLNQTPEDHQIIEGKAKEKTMNDKKQLDNPQEMIREHVPKVTAQLLGRHYNKVNNIASFISPDLNNKIADYFFDKLDDFSSSLSSVDHVLKEVGAKNLGELASDASRSSRISAALANQNKLIAAVQGAVTGATGVVGTAIDIPTSLVLTLRAIYQTGRAHGFELDRKSERDIVEYVFKQVDLGALAEKQTVLVALRAFSNVLETQNVQQLQTLLGSSNDFAVLQKWMSQEDGTAKWAWLNHIPKISILSKLTPLAGAGVGAVYSWKLIEDANKKAEVIFSSAQQYLLQHPNEPVDILTAYERSKALIEQASPLLNQDNQSAPNKLDPQSDLDSAPDQIDNQVIKEIRVEQKPEEKPEQESVAEGLKKLAETHVEPKPVESKSVDEKSAASKPDETQAKSEPQVNAVSEVEQKTATKQTTPAKTQADRQVEVKNEANATATRGNAKKTTKTNQNAAKVDSKPTVKVVKKSTQDNKTTQTQKQATESSSLTKKEEQPKAK